MVMTSVPTSAMYTIYTLYSTRVVFLLALLAFCCSPQLGGSQTLYQSNAIGVRIRPLPADASVYSYPYVLSVSGSAPTENETLYSRGRVVRRITRNTQRGGNVETTTKDSVLISEVSYDGNGRSTQEKWYNERGGLIETLQHAYGAGYKTIVSTDSAGAQRYSELHTYDLEGKINSVIRTYPNQRQEATFFDFINELLLREIHISPPTRYVIRYDQLGRAVERFRAIDGELQTAEFLVYGEGASNNPPRTPASSRVVKYDTNTVENRTYDRSGREITLEVVRDEAIVERGRFEYANQQLSKSVVYTTGSSTVREKSFGEERDPIEERWIDSGELVRRIVFTGENSSYEERYSNNTLFARIYYRGQNRIKEEFIRDGKVIRTREY